MMSVVESESEDEDKASSVKMDGVGLKLIDEIQA